MPEAESVAKAPTSGLRCVLNTLVGKTLPPSIATRSVKVQPTSMPIGPGAGNFCVAWRARILNRSSVGGKA